MYNADDDKGIGIKCMIDYTRFAGWQFILAYTNVTRTTPHNDERVSGNKWHFLV